MTILPTLALRSFVGFDNLFNELENFNNQKHSSFPAYDIIRHSDDEYEITLAVSGFNKKDICSIASFVIKIPLPSSEFLISCLTSTFSINKGFLLFII